MGLGSERAGPGAAEGSSDASIVNGERGKKVVGKKKGHGLLEATRKRGYKKKKSNCAKGIPGM